jgi:catechol 2,3-dioxygenase-like lactoylglutathione lyase family enzyme
MPNQSAPMKLNHLSFPSSDVPATAEFFVRYLGCTISSKAETYYVLKRDGFDIVIDRASNYTPAWPKDFHVGFELETVDDVQLLYKTFKDAGVVMETDVFNNTRGSRFFCRAPGGVMFEINTRADIHDKWQGTF